MGGLKLDGASGAGGGAKGGEGGADGEGGPGGDEVRMFVYVCMCALSHICAVLLSL